MLCLILLLDLRPQPPTYKMAGPAGTQNALLFSPGHKKWSGGSRRGGELSAAGFVLSRELKTQGEVTGLGTFRKGQSRLGGGSEGPCAHSASIWVVFRPPVRAVLFCGQAQLQAEILP